MKLRQLKPEIIAGALTTYTHVDFMSRYIYYRINRQVFFITPCVACGIDIDGRYFFEIGWLNFVVGFGDTYE